MPVPAVHKKRTPSIPPGGTRRLPVHLKATRAGWTTPRCCYCSWPHRPSASMAGPTASLGNPRVIPYDAAKLPKSIQFRRYRQKSRV